MPSSPACLGPDPIEAAARHAGPFLPHFSTPGGLEFEQWAAAERVRIQLAWERVAGEAVARLLDRGLFGDAVALARRLRDSAPDKDAAWRPLLESLDAAGDRPQAAIEAEALLARHHESGRTPTPQIVAVVERLRLGPAAPLATEPNGLRADLVGRSAAFAMLTRAWSTASTGVHRHCHIGGVAGIGKTRLLDEAAARFQAGGARLATAGGRWPDRALPFSLAAEVVRVVSHLPGARAIGPGSIPQLLALDPSLGTVFPGIPDAALGEEALRRRSYALADLLAAVAHERPFVLIVDDLHWSDPTSLRLLASAIPRIGNAPILLVTASRPDLRWPDGLTHAEVTNLESLDRDQVEQLVTSLAALPDEPWAGRLLDAVTAASEGIPLLVLEYLQDAIDRGELVITDGQWTRPSQDADEIRIEVPTIIGRRLDNLSPAARRIVEVLAIAAAPVPPGDLLSLLEESPAPDTLALLERRRFVRYVDGGLVVAHDLVVDRLVAGLSPDRQRELHAILGRHLATSGDLTDLGRAARHFAAAGETGLAAATFLRFRRLRTSPGTPPRPWRTDAAALFGENPSAALLDACRRALPFRHRQPVGALLLVALVVGFAAIGGVTALMAWLAAPYRLSLVVGPLADTPAVPFPAVAVVDRLGRRVEKPMEIRVRAADSAVAISGTLVRRTEGGVAVFSDLSRVSELDEPTRFIFESPNLRPVTTREPLGGNDVGLWLEGGEVNGTPLSSRSRRVVIAPGDSLIGSVTLGFTTVWASASVILATTRTWGPPDAGFGTLTSLPTPVEHAAGTFPVPTRWPNKSRHLLGDLGDGRRAGGRVDRVRHELGGPRRPAGVERRQRSPVAG